MVRIRNIFRKGNTTPEAVLADFASLLGAATSSAGLLAGCGGGVHAPAE